MIVFLELKKLNCIFLGIKVEKLFSKKYNLVYDQCQNGNYKKALNYIQILHLIDIIDEKLFKGNFLLLIPFPCILTKAYPISKTKKNSPG